MHEAWKFNSAGQIVFGNGAIRRLPQIIGRLGVRRVALLTDPGVAEAGVLRRVEGTLAAAGIEAHVYAEAMPEPDLASVRRCVDRMGSARPDLLIGLGGGSSMDLAKITGLLLTHGGDVSSYYGENKVPGRIMPVVAIPTTAGTGSEVSPVAIVTDEKLRIKVGLSDNHLRPAVALLDAELTLGLPARITACTGMDALTQAIEAYLWRAPPLGAGRRRPDLPGLQPDVGPAGRKGDRANCDEPAHRSAPGQQPGGTLEHDAGQHSVGPGILKLRRVVGACRCLPAGRTRGAAASRMMASSSDPQGLKDAFLQRRLTPFLGTPEDVAEATVYFALPRNRYVTGAILSVDGGSLAR